MGAVGTAGALVAGTGVAGMEADALAIEARAGAVDTADVGADALATEAGAAARGAGVGGTANVGVAGAGADSLTTETGATATGSGASAGGVSYRDLPLYGILSL